MCPESEDAMQGEPEDEIEMITISDLDGKEITIILKSDRPISNAQVILELEYYINQLSGAENMLDKGSLLH